MIGAYPLGRVNRAFFERLVNLATRNILRHTADTLKYLAAEAADAHFQALDVGERLDFLAVPAAHLGTRIATREIDDVVLGIELTHQFQAIAVVHPGGHLAAVEAEGDGAPQREGFIFAEEIVGRRVGAFNGTLLHTIDHTECRHQLASGMDGNLKLAARHGLDGF